MKLSIELDNELEDAVQQHLNGGVSVQGYVRAALRFFKVCREKEAQGNSIGSGEATRMEYNKIIATNDYLANEN